MKKMFISSFILLALFITNCSVNGNAYQKYWWTGSLGYIYDTNPSTPNTIYNDVYFPTSSGSFYMEYVSWDNSAWYMYYTITVKRGGDSWFEIGLYSTGPILYEWDSARNIQNYDVTEKNETPSVSIYKSDSKISTGKKFGEILGTDEKENINGIIKIEYGRILED